MSCQFPLFVMSCQFPHLQMIQLVKKKANEFVNYIPSLIYSISTPPLSTMAENFNITQQQQQIIEQQSKIIQQQQETIRTTTQMPRQSQTQRIERQIQALTKSLAYLRNEHNSDHKKLMKLISEVSKMKEEDSIFMSQPIP